MAIEKKSGENTRLKLVRSGDYQGLGDLDEDVKEIALAKIDLNPDQPRDDLGDMADMTASVKRFGVLVPLIVRQGTKGRYIIVAGERRYTAAKKAGLKAVLCIIRDLTEQDTAAITLIENLHRKNLTPFEEANGYVRLKANHNHSDGQIAKEVAKSRTYINQTLSVAKIPPRIQAKCQSSDTPISRDTLYLIAKQPTEAKMLQVLKDAQAGIPHEQRRARARKGPARKATAPKKPKWTHTVTAAKATVIVQSHNSSLTKQREIQALEEALKIRKKAK